MSRSHSGNFRGHPPFRGITRPEGISSTNSFAARPKQSSNRYYYDNIRFGNQTLQVFPNSNISFEALPHVSLSKEEKCLLDNLWIAYGSEPKDRRYFIACLNALSQHFNQTHNRFKFYVVLKGKYTCFFHTWIEVIEAIQGFNDPLYNGFNDYQQALTVARMHLRMNFYISDSLKHYTGPQ